MKGRIWRNSGFDIMPETSVTCFFFQLLTISIREPGPCGKLWVCLKLVVLHVFLLYSTSKPILSLYESLFKRQNISEKITNIKLTPFINLIISLIFWSLALVLKLTFDLEHVNLQWHPNYSLESRCFLTSYWHV